MAKKTKKKTVKADDINIDELVNDGKNLDMEKIEETIVVNEVKEETNSEEEVVKKLVEAIEDNQIPYGKNITEEDIAETLEVQAPLDEPIVDVMLDKEENDVTPEASIDDVIEECTGKAEEKKEKPAKKYSEPWYIARARRANDYYNW